MMEYYREYCVYVSPQPFDLTPLDFFELCALSRVPLIGLRPLLFIWSIYKAAFCSQGAGLSK